jgi:putative addiction module component (TIGR02574 family)
LGRGDGRYTRKHRRHSDSDGATVGVEGMSQVSEVLNLALALPGPERAALAHQLLLSLEADDFDADSETAWEAEIQARLDRVERGEFTANPWREALDRVRRKLSPRDAS